ncbi:MAG: preprotein translocase subunit SecY [Luteibaculaceae bacterium]
MKGFLDTIINIYKIKELRERILITLSLLLIYRIGSYIVLPGIDSAKLGALADVGSGGGITDLLSMFTGGAFSRASIFALGIMPYISAAIIMQLLGIAVPAVQKMQKDGESGRKKVTQYTRLLTIVITIFQAPGYISFAVDPAARPDTFFWWSSSILILTTGTLFIMWLGERITDRGIGNGISLLIMIGIIANLPNAFVQELVARLDAGGLVILIVELVILVVITGFTVLLVQGVRRVPIQFAKRNVTSGQDVQGARQYLPLKVNAAGVMPIIFAQAIMFVPLYLAQAFNAEPGSWLIALSDFGGLWYNIVFAVMIIAFTYFYTAITVNSNQMSDDLKRNGGFIPGVRPGKDTANYIDNILSKITLPGSIFLAAIAVLPAVAMLMGVKQQFSIFFGGTSLLIMVGVILDTLQQIESYLLMHHYDGLMKSGKIKGRKDSTFGMAG